MFMRLFGKPKLRIDELYVRQLETILKDIERAQSAKVAVGYIYDNDKQGGESFMARVLAGLANTNHKESAQLHQQLQDLRGGLQSWYENLQKRSMPVTFRSNAAEYLKPLPTTPTPSERAVVLGNVTKGIQHQLAITQHFDTTPTAS